ncbi:MAG TPA: type II toxin-antitoxin system HicB family antitoxin [Sphingomicrobium sp.]|nr:type II toxin-antitoxin system HicB family antitoxin [Sphingomicrobium sp.]
MATEVFTGVAERADDGYSVYFPDVPGCTSAGKSLLEAFANGEQALAFHIQGLVEDGEDLPRPSTDVRVEDDVQAVAFFLARVDLPGKAVRLNITMDEGLVANIDRIARNRSAFLAEAARHRLRELADA